MQKDMSKIIFENRQEVDDICVALENYLKEHPVASGRESIKRLADLLDVMYMEW